MNKEDLINALSEQSGETKAAVSRVLSALTDVSTKALKSGGEVTLHGLGKFHTAQRAARTVNSPLVGGKKDIPASIAAKFKPSKTLKEALN